MENINLKVSKNEDLLVRFTVMILLLVAGINKFYSHGAFDKYYLQQFANGEQRISLPSFLFNFYLDTIPFVEVGIAIALIMSLNRRFIIAIWILYFTTLEVAHYILKELTSVDLIIPYGFIGCVSLCIACIWE
jgi:hypothetical protein